MGMNIDVICYAPKTKTLEATRASVEVDVRLPLSERGRCRLLAAAPTASAPASATLTLALTPARSPNGPETGQKRGCAAFDFLFTIPSCAP